jgi:hypothetical protein
VRRIDTGDIIKLGPIAKLRVTAHRGQVAYTPQR